MLQPTFKRRHQPRVTHIDTLADNTPKARRRVRRILGWPFNKSIDAVDTRIAQVKARLREISEAEKVAVARRSHARAV